MNKKEFYDRNFVTMKCNCGEKECEGWAAINNNKDLIKAQEELYT